MQFILLAETLLDLVRGTAELSNQMRIDGTDQLTHFRANMHAYTNQQGSIERNFEK